VLDSNWTELADRAFAHLARAPSRQPDLDTAAAASTRRVVADAIRFLRGAIVTDDDELFVTSLAGLAVVGARHGPRVDLDECLHSIDAALPKDLVDAHRLLTVGHASLERDQADHEAG